MLANSVNSEMLDTLEKKYNNNELSRTDLENIMTDARESVDLISRNLQRAADLVQNFKRFSVDRPAPIFEKLRLQDSVKTLIVSLNPEYQKSDIKVHYKLDPELSIVTNPPYLFQALNSVLMNIPTHAFRVHDVTQERTVEILANLDSSDSLKLEIKDNGRGMDQETLKNAFEPFFTTARSDGRIGFGLHHAYTIITRFLYGQISLQSAPGSGTCVLITLPLNGNMVSGQ